MISLNSVGVSNIPFLLETARGGYPGIEIVSIYGRNSDVDAAEDIWGGGGDYPGFPTQLETVHIFSSDATDTAAGTGARSVRIYGLDTNYNRIEEVVATSGVTPVASTQQFRRIYFAVVESSGTARKNAGTITCRHTTTTANVFFAMPIGTSQTSLTNYTVPLGYSAYMLHRSVFCFDTTTNQAIMAFKVRHFVEGTDHLMLPFPASTEYPYAEENNLEFQLSEKDDVVVRAISVLNANADISTHYTLILVRN